MARDEQELTQEQALERAQLAVETGPLALLGIKLQSPDEVRQRMAMSLLDATTIDDILSENSTSSWQDHEGKPFLIRDVSYSPSTKRGGLGFYAIVDAIDMENDKPTVLTSGSENVVLQVAKLKQVGGLDVPVMLVARSTSEGNTVHKLVKAEPGVKPPF